MANELTLIFELQNAIPFTCADGTGIEKGTLLSGADLMSAGASDKGNQTIAGISASEKIASDGKVKIGAFRKGIFKGTASGAIGMGMPLCCGGVDNVISQATADLSGATIFGTSLEVAADGETFLLDLNIGASAGAG